MNTLNNAGAATDASGDVARIDTIVRHALADVAPEADLATLDPAASLQDALDLDSMDFLNFVTALHDATGVDIPERDYALIDTVSSCIDYLERHLYD